MDLCGICHRFLDMYVWFSSLAKEVTLASSLLDNGNLVKILLYVLSLYRLLCFASDTEKFTHFGVLHIVELSFTGDCPQFK